MQAGVPPGDSSSKDRGDDLLPLDPKHVGEVLGSVDPQLVGAVQLVVNTLNYLALGVQEVMNFPTFPSRAYTRSQVETIRMLGERVSGLREGDETCPTLDEAAQQLSTAKFDYMGEPVLPMKNL